MLFPLILCTQTNLFFFSSASLIHILTCHLLSSLRYAIVCDCKNHSAVERLRRFARNSLFLVFTTLSCLFIISIDFRLFLSRIKKIESSKVRDMPSALSLLLYPYIYDYVFMQPLSILCPSFRDIDTYTMGFPRGHANVFRAVKQCLPGPVSYSLHSSALLFCLIHDG